MQCVIAITIITLSIAQFATSQYPSYILSINKLNCSSFGVNATVSSALQNWEARLHACFDANPYDTEHLPLAPSAMPLQLLYDWSLVNLISFENGILKACRLKIRILAQKIIHISHLNVDFTTWKIFNLKDAFTTLLILKDKNSLDSAIKYSIRENLIVYWVLRQIR